MALREIFPDEAPSGHAALRGADLSLPGTLWRRRMTVAVALLATLASAAAYLHLAPEKYTASTAIMLDPRLGQELGEEAMRATSAPDPAAIESQVKMLTSQTVLERLARANRLENDPEFNGGDKGLASIFAAPPVLRAGVDLKALASSIAIKRPERSYLVEIEATARDPVQAAHLADGLAEAYAQDQIEARVEVATRDLRWVEGRLASLQADIDAAQAKVVAFRSSHHVVDGAGLRANELQIAEATRALGLARGRESELKARLDQRAAQARADAPVRADAGLDSPVVERLRSMQAQAERDKARLAGTLGARHPAMAEARAEIDRIGALLKAEYSRIGEAERREYSAASANVARLEKAVDRLKARSSAMDQSIAPLAQMEKDVESLRTTQERLFRLRDGLRQQQSDAPPSRVVATASIPVAPSSPKRGLVLVAALFYGLLNGVAAALIGERISRGKALPARPRKTAAQEL